MLVGISIDPLPLFRYSLDSHGHLLLARQELNKFIQNDIYSEFVQATWKNPQSGLRLKMAFNIEHFMKVREGLLSNPRIFLVIECNLFIFHKASFEWAHIVFELKHITRLSRKIGFSNGIIFERSIQRSTSFSVAPSTMRFEGGC
jgi:hypothetical protein